MADGGVLSIDVSEAVLEAGEVEGLAPGAFVRLAVRDTGSGMDEATLRRAVEPFYTTKGVGKGTGLGLSMVHGLAAQSGGSLRLSSQPGQGTSAEIWLPVSDRTADPVRLLEAEPLAAHRSTTILLVDDEDLVRRGTAEMLREMGHEVIEAASGLTALEHLGERPEIELVVSDYLMPGMRGGDLIRRARRLRPEIRALLITGYAKLAGEPTGAARLSKPFRAGDLSRAIAKLLADEGGKFHP
jgi:CheY-like chemotaxis protein